MAARDAELGLIAFAMYLDGKPIALQWGFIHQNRYFAFLSSRNPEFEDFSVGRIHLQHVLEVCHERGVGELDLMVPAVPYKMSWTKKTESVVDVIWPWSLKGYLVLGLFERHIRWWAKRIVSKLPAVVRQKVFCLAHH